jgi:hypothetical protein
MFATLNGSRVTKAQVIIGFKGPWTADVWIEDATEITGAVTLVIGDLSLKGTVTRGGNFTGQGSFRLIGGAGGWMKQLSPRYYKSPFGVKASNVLTDAGREVGETVSVTSDRTLGQFYVREQGPAARVLALLAEQWWLREDGVTVVGPRATPTFVTPFEVIKADREKGRVLISTDNPADWIPGARFSSATIPTQTINAVVHKVSPTSLRSEVWTNG